MDIIRKDSQTWIIEDGGVRCFVLEGDKYSALIDTGMKIEDIRKVGESLTDRPILLLNTHADRDHIGSNGQFDTVYLGIHELQHYQLNHFDQKLIPLYEGDVIDLGNRKLTVYDLSGHTPGSIAFYDEDRNVLISGDPIQKGGKVFMFGEQRSLAGYVKSLERLLERKPAIREIWPSHAELPLDDSYIEKCLEDGKDLLDGKLKYEVCDMFGRKVRACQGRYNIYLCDE